MLTPNTFNDDKLGLKPFCEKFENYLLVEHDFVEGGLVVSLDAPFGSGKTTFLKMWKHELDLRHLADSSAPQALILNAWELDYCNDPLFAILARLIPATEIKDQEKLKKLREAATDLGWYTTALANSVVSKWTGIDAMKAGETAEKKKTDRNKKPDFLKLYEERAKAFDRLKESLVAIFGGSEPKAFILIDELDRCRPDYAVTYLETIKHMFDVHGLVFVLAIDSKHLESSARSLFGIGLNFPEYFRKFVQRCFTLPTIQADGYEQLSNNYIDHYVEKVGKRISLLNLDRVRHQTKELVAGYKLTPRQIQEAFRIMGHAAVGDDKRRGQIFWCIGAGLIFMSILKVGRPDLYHSIGRQSQDHIKVGHEFCSFMSAYDAEWWFKVYITGLYRPNSEEELNLEAFLRELRFIKSDQKFEEQSYLGSFYQGWGDWRYGTKSRLMDIYQRIETAAVF